jgi:hypothetical protein
MPHLIYQVACGDKHRFDTKDEGTRVLLIMRKYGHTRLCVDKCNFCPGYHIAHRDHSPSTRLRKKRWRARKRLAAQQGQDGRGVHTHDE